MSKSRYREKVGKISTITTWTSLLFSVPLALALWTHLWVMAALITAVIPVSLFYHYSGGRRLVKSDRILAWLLMAANLALIGFGGFTTPFAELAVLTAAFATFVWFKESRRNYMYMHGLWHTLSAITTVFAILSFI